jgi:multidrug efflux pump subunit AcrA (membrane-fusion protein)
MNIRNHLNVSRVLTTAAGIRVLVDELEALPVGADFEEFEPEARVAKDETLAGLQQALKQQVEREAEAARLQSEREEQARVAAEQKRQADELEAQRRAIAEQQAALERQQREAAEAMARQQAELERERAKLIEQQQLTLDQMEDATIKADAAPPAAAELAFPGTDDGRTVEEFDAGTKAENERLKAEIPPTLTLGKISDRLGFTVTRGLLDELGIKPAGRERAAVLYHEFDFGPICAALIERIQKAARDHS